MGGGVESEPGGGGGGGGHLEGRGLLPGHDQRRSQALALCGTGGSKSLGHPAVGYLRRLSPPQDMESVPSAPAHSAAVLQRGIPPGSRLRCSACNALPRQLGRQRPATTASSALQQEQGAARCARPDLQMALLPLAARLQLCGPGCVGCRAAAGSCGGGGRLRGLLLGRLHRLLQRCGALRVALRAAPACAPTTFQRPLETLRVAVKHATVKPDDAPAQQVSSVISC